MALLLVEKQELDFVPARRTTSLEEWLAGRWGMLFSHPEDFDCEPTPSRGSWIARLAREFDTRGVRPVRVSREASDLGSGWIGDALGQSPLLGLSRPGRPRTDAARRLRHDIDAAGPRWVMVVAPLLQCRATISCIDRRLTTVDELLSLASVLLDLTTVLRATENSLTRVPRAATQIRRCVFAVD